MKTNLTKILVLAFSLALLVGAVIGISASAEEYTYEIKSMNIAHGDTTIVLVAVDAPATGVAPEGVTVTYVDANGETQTAKYYDDLNVYGTTYPVYYTKGISAKDLGQDIVATVTVGEEAKDEMNVSVAEYLYGKLYREGFIDATEAKDVNRKNLYLNLLDYAASAETVLWNDKAENADNQRTLITDKFYIYAEGIVEDVLEPTETFTLNYTGTAPEGYTFSGYWKSTVGGASYITDGVATKPTKHAVYTPVFYLTEEVAGKYYNSENAGARYDFAEGFNNTVYSAENPDGDLAGDFISGSTDSYNSGKANLAVNGEALEFNMSSPTWAGFTLSAKGNGTGEKYVAEFDFTFTGGTAYTGSSKHDDLPFFIGLTTSDENNGNYLLGGNQSVYIDNYNGLALFGVPMVKGETYNVRIVYDSNGTYSAYVDDVCTYTSGFDAADASIAGLGIYVRSRHAGDTFGFKLDNVYIGAFDGSYFADRTIEGTRYDFTDEIALEQYNAETAPNGIFAGTFTADDTQAIITDKTLAITNTDGRLLVDMTKREWAGFTLANKGDTTGVTGSKYIIEFDFTYLSNSAYTGSGVNYNPFAFGVSCSGGALNSMIRYNNVWHKDNTYNTDLTFNSFVLEKGKTYKIRIESTVGGNELIYVDNVLIGTNAGSKGNANDPTVFAGLGIYFRDRHAGAQFSFALDNVFMTTIDPQ